MFRTLLLIIFHVIVLHGFGQLEVPTSIDLVGGQNSDRQINGIAFPQVPDAAISAEGVRSNASSFTEVSGTNILSGALTPPLSSYSPGLVVQIVPQAANHANAQLDLNALGPRPMIKLGGLPLDSADLWPGSPVRLIYDGQAFLVLSTVSIPCKTGFHVGGREFCIENNSRSAKTFLDAVLECDSLGSRLCKNSEWVYACRSEPSFFGTVVDYEWVDDAANALNHAKQVGFGYDGMNADLGSGCERGFSVIHTTLSRFRCCMTR